MDSVVFVTCMTAIVLLVLTIASTTKVDQFISDPDCRMYPTKNLSCYDYLTSCHPQYLRNEIGKDFLHDRLSKGQIEEREAILRRMLAGGPGGNNPSPGYCRIPYNEFQNFELNRCPKNFEFLGTDIGCVAKVGSAHERGVTQEELAQAFKGPPTDPKNRIRAAAVFAGISTSVGLGATAGLSAATAYAAAKSVKIKTDTLMDGVSKADASWRKGLASITSVKKIATAVAGRKKNVRISTAFSPKLPTSIEFPDLEGLMKEYEQDYFKKYNIFSNAPTRCGYINGRIWDKDNQDEGKEAIIPIIQKRFGDKYYSLLYKYTTAAYKQLKPNRLVDWFTKDFNWDKPEPKLDRMDDPMKVYKTIDEFLSNERETYRDPYLMNVFKSNSSRFSLIVEVFNQYNPNALVTLEFVKYSSDMVDRNKADVSSNKKLNDPITKKNREESLKDSMKWFNKWRLKDSPFTSNKRLLYDQFNCSTFGIDTGPEHSWTISYAKDDKPNCQDHRVFFTIPTGSSCQWQAWFKGNIVVAQDEPVNLGEKISDFNDFRKKHIGEWMNVWLCADNDPFQAIEMVEGIPNFNPYAFRDIVIRKPNQNDEAWAMYIWKSISKDGAAAQYNDAYKALVKQLKGKNIMSFSDYRMACDAALSNANMASHARDAGCI